MKKSIHPQNYRAVVFQDLNNNETFLTKSTVETADTITLSGIEYPLVKVHISSASHPFFTGQEKLVDIEGRVDKFNARLQASKNKKNNATKKISKSVEPKKESPKKLANLKAS
jgi:large subunit ribosomal protein L31